MSPRLLVWPLSCALVGGLSSGCYTGLDPEELGTGIPTTTLGPTSADGTGSGGETSSGGNTSDPTASTTDPSTTNPSTTDPSTTDPTTTTSGGNGDIIEGISIDEVAIYQGVKRTLAQGGSQANSSTPLIRGRDALVRVFYTASGEAQGASVTAVLEINGQEAAALDATLSGSSSDSGLNSTINFELDGAQVGSNFDYSVQIYAQGNNQVPSAAHPPGGSESHNVAGGQQTLRVVLVPYAYDADGSGRLPDTSNAAVAAYREALLQIYPVSDVEVTVHAPVAWGSTISPFGQGWSSVLNATLNLRAQESPANGVYYYGIFNPASSFNGFCGGGCILGLAPLNSQPASTGQASSRVGVGVGYLPEYAVETATHEIGHAHGREHVNCGQGLDPNSIDNGYPYATNTIGSWGWDIVNGGLKNPNSHTDFMGYCDSQWISDYNYTNLFNRGNNVNAANEIYEPELLVQVSVDGEGEGTWNGPIELEPFASPADVRATLTDDEGRQFDLDGHYIRFDHLPGGWLMFPPEALDAVELEVEIDGVWTVVSR